MFPTRHVLCLFIKSWRCSIYFLYGEYDSLEYVTRRYMLNITKQSTHSGGNSNPHINALAMCATCIGLHANVTISVNILRQYFPQVNYNLSFWQGGWVIHVQIWSHVEVIHVRITDPVQTFYTLLTAPVQNIFLETSAKLNWFRFLTVLWSDKSSNKCQTVM